MQATVGGRGSVETTDARVLRRSRSPSLLPLYSLYSPSHSLAAVVVACSLGGRTPVTMTSRDGQSDVRPDVLSQALDACLRDGSIDSYLVAYKELSRSVGRQVVRK